MTANTPKLQLPYPTGTDPVINGDDAIKALADTLDAGMIPYRMAAGSKLLTASAVSSLSIAVAFTAGRFTMPPLVVCSLGNAPGGSGKAVPRAMTPTTSGWTLWVYSGDGTTMTFTSLQVNWHAIQMLPGASNGGDA